MIEKRKESRPPTTQSTTPHRTTKGPEPERFKVEGYANWEDAVKAALHKPKPLGGWPKK